MDTDKPRDNAGADTATRDDHKPRHTGRQGLGTGDRSARLSNALRENLARRKAQDRARLKTGTPAQDMKTRE